MCDPLGWKMDNARGVVAINQSNGRANRFPAPPRVTPHGGNAAPAQ